jgi:hypothetical protein
MKEITKISFMVSINKKQSRPIVDIISVCQLKKEKKKMKFLSTS